VILLNGDERIPINAGELIKLTVVAKNYVLAVAASTRSLFSAVPQGCIPSPLFFLCLLTAYARPFVTLSSFLC
jgi:hypothetical protein